MTKITQSYPARTKVTSRWYENDTFKIFTQIKVAQKQLNIFFILFFLNLHLKKIVFEIKIYNYLFLKIIFIFKRQRRPLYHTTFFFFLLLEAYFQNFLSNQNSQINKIENKKGK